MKSIFVILAIILCVVISGCTTAPITANSKGTPQFSTSPEGAQIYLDNEYKGTTPATISGVSAGTHTLEFRYSGYQNWKATITVPAGSSSYYAALSPLTASTTAVSTQGSGVVSTQPVVTSGTQPAITLQVSQETLILGGSQVFYGTCTGSSKVILVVYGPGSYTNGVTIAEPVVSSDNTWSYTWNKGTSLMSGTYTVVAYDSQKLVSDKKIFSVVGGGTVSIVTASPTVTLGETVSFTGICTTGAKSVTLVLYGPGQYSSGMTLATLTPAADHTWSYKYTFDIAKPLGAYTITVHDAQNTASASVTVNLGSSS